MRTPLSLHRPLPRTGVATTIRRLGLAILGLLCACPLAHAQVSACDLNSDGQVNILDVQLAVNMNLGTTPCTANVIGSKICNDAVVNRVVDASLGKGCHYVTLTWAASTTANLKGYNLYRRTGVTGAFSLLNAVPVTGLTYIDSTVESGVTYLYVARAVGANNEESADSNASTVTVPTP